MSTIEIFIINLEKSTTRRKNIKQQLDRLSLKGQFIEAIDGRTLDENTLKNSVYHYPETHLTKGEIGCAMSHLKVYQKIVDEQIPYALILEDDVVLPDDLPTQLQNIQTNTTLLQSEKANLILLSYGHGRYHSQRKIPVTTIHSIYPSSGAYTAFAYLITLSAAQNLLSFLRPIRFESDRWGVFSHCGMIQLYKMIPAIIQVNEQLPSTIGDDERIAAFAKRAKDTKRMVKTLPFSLSVRYTLNRIKTNLNWTLKKGT